MMKSWLLVALLVLLSGCATFQYIPSKHVVHKESKIINDEEFTFYLKQINGKPREVYQFNDTFDVMEGILNLYPDGKGFELYYEMNDQIDIDRVMAYIRSLSAQRYRMFYGNSNDFGMLKIEPINPEEHTLAHEEVKRIIAEEMDLTASVTSQIRFVHDYLIKHTAYDVSVTQGSSISQDSLSLTVYGTLFNQIAVCEGYARTFLLFMQELGIPSLIIEAQGMNHAWNYVLVNDEWLFVDVTYDDPVPNNNRVLRSDYFLLNESNFLKKGSHTFDDGETIGVSIDEYKQITNFLLHD